ncbi:hypothetical protein LXA43DRAFT_882820 [Ganoderma leucocontextum]|nr:hypothetical protein LXA43DRAFT_882820 [Ganoderma leucocontextum]
MKTAARALVETAYRFHVSAKSAVQLRNRERAAQLLKGDAFVYRKRGKSEDEHEDLYQAEIIQQMVNRVYFKNKNDDGIALKDRYSPFPFVSLALILAAIECAITEWNDGTFTKIPFTEDAYKPVYKHHLQELHQYEAATELEGLKIVTEICEYLYSDGRMYAKASPDESLITRSLSMKAYAKGIADFKRRGGRLAAATSDIESTDEDDA